VETPPPDPDGRPGRSDTVNGKQGDHPLTDIVNWGIEVFSADIDAKVRDLVELGSFRNDIAANWLLEASGLLYLAREAGQVEHLGGHFNESQVLAYVDGVLTTELSRHQSGRASSP
jgi:hypothetical protein